MGAVGAPYAAVPPVRVAGSGREFAVVGPDRPRRAWSHLEVVPSHEAARFRWGDGTGRMVDPLELTVPPSVADVVAAEVADVHGRLWSAATVAPPDGTAGCWFCGVGTAARARWRPVEGHAWCSACPGPGSSPVEARDWAVSFLLGRAGTLSGIARMAGVHEGRLWWGERDPRPAPSSVPWGWLDPAELEVWRDRAEKRRYNRLMPVVEVMAAHNAKAREEAIAQRVWAMVNGRPPVTRP